LNAERAEFAETFHAENAESRRCAEAGHHSAAGGPRAARPTGVGVPGISLCVTRPHSVLCVKPSPRALPPLARWQH